MKLKHFIQEISFKIAKNGPTYQYHPEISCKSPTLLSEPRIPKDMTDSYFTAKRAGNKSAVSNYAQLPINAREVTDTSAMNVPGTILSMDCYMKQPMCDVRTLVTAYGDCMDLERSVKTSRKMPVLIAHGRRLAGQVSSSSQG